LGAFEDGGGEVLKLSKGCRVCLKDGKYEDVIGLVEEGGFVRGVPDIVVFFNAGFTCLDYDWKGCLEKCFEKEGNLLVPFLATTNSELENYNDMEWLEENGFVKEGSLAGLGEDVDDADFDEGEG
jgi:hypothetical protein